VANSIRVYELARELGMANAQVIDLCSSLGIGVKSHSSGMVEAQADRVRRKAERDGLVVALEQVEEVVAPIVEPVVEEVAEEAPTRELPPQEPSAEDELRGGGPRRVISSSGSAGPTPRTLQSVEPEPSRPTAARPSDGPVVPDLGTRVGRPSPQTPSPGTTPPVSVSGKPIPPPPGTQSPMSASG